MRKTGYCVQPWRFWIAACLVLAAGCGKVNLEKSATLEPGDFKAITIDAPRSEQKVSVSATSTGAPIDVYIALEGDPDTALKLAEDLARGSKPPASVIASKQKATEATFDAVIPARKGYSVLLVNGSTKKADVNIKIAGK
jgi:hypothetical protein